MLRTVAAFDRIGEENAFAVLERTGEAKVKFSLLRGKELISTKG